MGLGSGGSNRHTTVAGPAVITSEITNPRCSSSLPHRVPFRARLVLPIAALMVECFSVRRPNLPRAAAEQTIGLSAWLRTQQQNDSWRAAYFVSTHDATGRLALDPPGSSYLRESRGQILHTLEVKAWSHCSTLLLQQLLLRRSG